MCMGMRPSVMKLSYAGEKEKFGFSENNVHKK